MVPHKGTFSEAVNQARFLYFVPFPKVERGKTREAKYFGLRSHKNSSSSELSTIAEIHLELNPKGFCLWDQII